MTTDTFTDQKTCRLLYFGPADSGKRANLRYIHQSLPPEKMVPVQAEDPERQIGFRVQHGDQGEWKVVVQSLDLGMETVPEGGRVNGQSPFDGIVFVVDSGLAGLDEGLAALEALKAHLDNWGLDMMGIPVVLQYNGRNRGEIMPVDQMESLLNPWGLLSYPADANTGEGVRETLKAILGLTIKDIVENPRPTEDPEMVVAPTAADLDSTEQVPGSTMPEMSELGIDYGPPLPGTEIAEGTKARGNEIFEDLNPPVVIPVKIPRRLVEGRGDFKILLEVEIEDDPTF